MTIEANQGHDGSDLRATITEFEPHNQWNFRILQSRTDSVFKEHDEMCGYDAYTMLIRMDTNASALERIVRKNPDQFGKIDRHLKNIVIWTATLANYSGISLQEIMEEKYGAVCPRCGQNPCLLSRHGECREGVLPRQIIDKPIPSTLDEWQDHLATLYPRNFKGNYPTDLGNIVRRIGEEIGELSSSAGLSDVSDIVSELSHHDLENDADKPWEGEFADILAWVLAASAIIKRYGATDYSVGKSLKDELTRGCGYCGGEKCMCPKETLVFKRLHDLSKKN